MMGARGKGDGQLQFNVDLDEADQSEIVMKIGRGQQKQVHDADGRCATQQTDSRQCFSKIKGKREFLVSTKIRLDQSGRPIIDLA